MGNFHVLLTSCPDGRQQFQDDCRADRNSPPGQHGLYDLSWREGSFPGWQGCTGTSRPARPTPPLASALDGGLRYHPPLKLTCSGSQPPPFAWVSVGGSSAPRGLEPSDSLSWYEGCQSGPEHKDQSSQKSGWSWNQRALLSPQPAHCPTPPFLLQHRGPTAKQRPRSTFLCGLARTPYPPGYGSCSHRSAGEQLVVKRQPAQTFFQNETSAGGWGGWG